MWGFNVTSIPRNIYVHVTGYPMQHVVFLHFLKGKHLQCRLNFSLFFITILKDCFTKARFTQVGIFSTLRLFAWEHFISKNSILLIKFLRKIIRVWFTCTNLTSAWQQPPRLAVLPRLIFWEQSSSCLLSSIEIYNLRHTIVRE